MPTSRPAPAPAPAPAPSLRPPLLSTRGESSACGVGFVASRTGRADHALLEDGLAALACHEHRGACDADGLSSDGAGVMTDIPFELLGIERGRYAVATLFVLPPGDVARDALRVFEETFAFYGLRVSGYRDVPVDPDVLGPRARANTPIIRHVFIERSPRTRTVESFETLLYLAKQMNRTKVKEAGLAKRLSMPSLSSRTIIYKALTRAADLARFYPDLRDPQFRTRFVLFHRRFSTNTGTTWSRAQPLRLIAHNGEINTVLGNRSWCHSREQALGVGPDELLTREGASDSLSLNEMVEALRHRSSIPQVEQALAILMPPATERNDYYRFWGRSVEPWDGPAFVTYCDGARIGARLDRNGFRPCRWTRTADRFHLASEAGAFDLEPSAVEAHGTLAAGSGVTLYLDSGALHFLDPSRATENRGATFDARIVDLEPRPSPAAEHLVMRHLHGVTHEELEKVLVPMARTGKEPIGSMGDTARPAIFSDLPRPLFDYVFQTFAQVTNPPLDVLREMLVTDLDVVLGKRPNVFTPKELIPPPVGIGLKSPILSLGAMAALRDVADHEDDATTRVSLHPLDIATCFALADGADGLRAALDGIGRTAREAALAGHRVLILTDRGACAARPPVPSLLALRAVVNALNRDGLRLECSIVADTADARTTHQVAALIGFGASAVCPYLALEIAREARHRLLDDLEPDERERHMLAALELGLLKVMSKMGISVVRSYQSAKLFTAVGLSRALVDEFLPSLTSPIGGLTLEHLADDVRRRVEAAATRGPEDPPIRTFELREDGARGAGEQHAMTAQRSRMVHEAVAADPGSDAARAAYDAFVQAGRETAPMHIRDLLDVRPAERPLSLDAVQPREEILSRFGSGAMSFGAISAESQADIFRAMHRIGGRCNSGEGGENPSYYADGTHATTKQIASGRFGVTAEYLVTGDEIEIKVAQGAKPGEGGQLMGVKVSADIAHARHTSPGVDLISPAPLHDIYSIEDLKQLIYELRQLAPESAVCVKLVAGANIGTIAVGVVKAGADVIQISGGDGGTGAASISSMKHAGLPWELGLVDVHQVLVEQGLREAVRLRVDGGLSTGRDVVLAAALGADEFGFGKLLLIAVGCIMARICEKNRCPRGIATHDPRFLAKYVGGPGGVVRLLTLIADDVRDRLAKAGVPSLDALRGRASLLRESETHAADITRRGIDLSGLLAEAATPDGELPEPRFAEPASDLNTRIVDEAAPALGDGTRVQLAYDIRSTDRAVLARLAGALAERRARLRAVAVRAGDVDRARDGDFDLPAGSIRAVFTGSAGQGFAAFQMPGADVLLRGEANDSVAKSMSGGRVVVVPHPEATFAPEDNVIMGNCVLYGATGGELFVGGRVGDRFAVRNSGARAVVEGAGLHACEYMTNGVVVILGDVSHNVGSGMTGGTLYLRSEHRDLVHPGYVRRERVLPDDATFRELLERHAELTDSRVARALLGDLPKACSEFRMYVPR